jgi:repressor of nif and glnA expression
LPVVERVLAGLRKYGIGGVLVTGTPSEEVCGISVEPNKIGLVLIGGLNPVAAAQEAGVQAQNHSMSTVADYGRLITFSELLGERSKSNPLS